MRSGDRVLLTEDGDLIKPMDLILTYSYHCPVRYLGNLLGPEGEESHAVCRTACEFSCPEAPKEGDAFYVAREIGLPISSVACKWPEDIPLNVDPWEWIQRKAVRDGNATG